MKQLFLLLQDEPESYFDMSLEGSEISFCEVPQCYMETRERLLEEARKNFIFWVNAEACLANETEHSSCGQGLNQTKLQKQATRQLISGEQ